MPRLALSLQPTSANMNCTPVLGIEGKQLTFSGSRGRSYHRFTSGNVDLYTGDIEVIVRASDETTGGIRLVPPYNDEIFGHGEYTCVSVTVSPSEFDWVERQVEGGRTLILTLNCKELKYGWEPDGSGIEWPENQPDNYIAAEGIQFGYAFPSDDDQALNKVDGIMAEPAKPMLTRVISAPKVEPDWIARGLLAIIALALIFAP
jgi:hypothetical protein